MSNNSRKTRVEYIDCFRGIGILLMIMGHVGFGAHFDKFIHAFHVPMFFIVSGMFFSNSIASRNYIMKKIKSLIIPYFMFGMVHCLVYYLQSNTLDESIVVRLVLNTTLGMPVPGTLWFLLALFWADVIYFYIDEIARINMAIRNVLVIGVLCLGMVSSAGGVNLPLSLGCGLIGVGFFHVGWLFKNYFGTKFVNRILNLKPAVCIAIGLIVTLLIFKNEYVNLRILKFGFIPLFYVNAILAFIVGINLSKMICGSKLDSCKVVSYIKSLGRDSIVFLCLNQLIIEVLRPYFENIPIDAYAVNFMLLIVTLCILEAAVAIIYRSKLRFMIGK